MSMTKAVSIGLAGNAISKKITGTSKVSAGRTAVATGSGAALGATAAGTIAIGATAAGLTMAAPITVPLAVGGAIVGGITSLFD